MKTVNIKEGFPSVEQARTRLRSELDMAQRQGLQVLKIIHGYGSHGTGGDLRVALQSTLRSMARSGQIVDCIYGENWRNSDERSWELLKRIPGLKKDPDLGQRKSRHYYRAAQAKLGNSRSELILAEYSNSATTVRWHDRQVAPC